MDSIIMAKVKHYLQRKLGHRPHDCGAIWFNICKTARAGGYSVDDRFARSGLGSGPEARAAAEIVARATGNIGGTPTTEHQLRLVTQRWIRTTPPMGL